MPVRRVLRRVPAGGQGLKHDLVGVAIGVGQDG